MAEIIYTKNAPDAIGPYSQAVKTGSLVFTSGQIAINPASGNVEAETIEEQTEQVCKNLSAVLTEAGTSIDKDGATNYHWTADYEYLSSETYSLLRTFEKTIRKGEETQGANFEIKAFLWHQGEGDADTEAVALRYYDNLKNMLAYVRGIVGNPRLDFFCGNLSENNHANPYVGIINDAYAQLASEDPYFHCVDMRNAVLEDSWHFNYQWSIYFGQKVYDMMIDAGIISGTKINPSEPS